MRRKRYQIQSTQTYNWQEVWVDTNKIEDTITLASQVRNWYTKDISTRLNRWNKAEVYKIAGNILREFSIKGSYIGLGGFYIPEIIQAFGKQIKGSVINCEKKKKYIPPLEEHTELLNKIYKHPKFFLARGNIFRTIQKSKDRYSILDLDLMMCLDEEKLNKITDAVEKAAANKCLLCLWTCYGKAIHEDEYNSFARPQLLEKLTENFKILTHKSIKYRDNVIPMKVELLALSRRKGIKK
jgi:hypothetical protein